MLAVRIDHKLRGDEPRKYVERGDPGSTKRTSKGKKRDPRPTAREEVQ